MHIEVYLTFEHEIDIYEWFENDSRVITGVGMRLWSLTPTNTVPEDS